MRQNYYSDYSGHALRIYAKHKDDADFDMMSEADKLSWECAKACIGTFKRPEQEILLKLYQLDGPFSDRIALLALEYGFSMDSIWHLSDRAIKDFATRRGLI